MKKTMLLSIALALWMGKSNAQIPLISMMDDELTEQLGPQVTAIVEQKAKDDYSEYRILYRIPEDKVDLLKRTLKARELRRTLNSLINASNVKRRVEGKIEIDKFYQDSLYTVLIPGYKNKVSGDNVSLALCYAKGMELDSKQYNHLMAVALDMAHRLHEDPRLDLFDEDLDYVLKTLNTEQINHFFRIKNSGVVTKLMNVGWERLKNAGLTDQVDSVSAMSGAFVYYHEQQKIKDIYRHKGSRQKKYLAELAKNKPLMIKMLDGLDKEAVIKEKETTVGKEFVW